jgi:hypothetical protein
MGSSHKRIEATLPSGAHRVVVDAANAVLVPRAIIAPELPPGALSVSVGGVVLVPDTRIVRPRNKP